MSFSPLVFERLAAMASSGIYCPVSATKDRLSAIANYCPPSSATLPRSPFAIQELLGLTDRNTGTFESSANAFAAIPFRPEVTSTTFPWRPGFAPLSSGNTTPLKSDTKNYSDYADGNY